MFKELAPDLVITFGNIVSPIKQYLRNIMEIVIIDLNADGCIDTFRKLRYVFECTPQFFESLSDGLDDKQISLSCYDQLWMTYLSKLPSPNLDFSSMYVMQKFLENVPDHSIIHYGNGVAVHMAQYFQYSSTNILLPYRNNYY